ncbi:MAG: magnesium chelatase, partial [Bacteroidia bacterium]|nr:magnesium chelatase [Bacteroidia bacterium]
LLDRIDLHVEVTPVSFEELEKYQPTSEPSTVITERVTRARHFQAERFQEYSDIHSNAMMPSRMVRDVCKLDNPGKSLLKTAMSKLQLSARAYDRILKVSRTIADLDCVQEIQAQHVAEAIQYRSLDRDGWAG